RDQPARRRADRRAVRQSEAGAAERRQRARADLRLRALPQRLHQAGTGCRRGLRRALSGSDSRGQPVREGKPVAGARRRSRGAAQTERTHRDPFSKVRAQERELTRMLPRESATLEERTRDVAALAKRTNKAAVLVVQQFPVAAVENVGP